MKQMKNIFSLVLISFFVGCSLNPILPTPGLYRAVTDTWTETIVEASSSFDNDIIELANGQVRMSYREGVNDSLIEKILVGTIWTGPYLISSYGVSSQYLQLENGDLWIVYKNISSGNIVWRKWGTTFWDIEQVISTSGHYPTIVEHNGIIRCSYSKDFNGGDSYIVERTYNGTTWSNEVRIDTDILLYAVTPDYICRSNGELRLSYTVDATYGYYLVEHILEGADWGQRITVVSGDGAAHPSYNETLSGVLEITYTSYSNYYVEKKVFNEITGWGNAIQMTNIEAFFPSLLYTQDGNQRLLFSRISDEYLVERVGL